MSEMNHDEVVVSVKNLSKKFSRNIKRSLLYGTLDLARDFIGAPGDRSKLRKSEFWSLKNVNFELKKGEILGVIGVNGSGKSTLLRVLNGIFPPDEGEVTINGSIGGLIAVGAGFHPHMTGRENIYLNGTLLGMSREEINDKYEEIVNFADIGDFLESPISTYSSGMKVRLGFSIAIHIRPDILLVDEVLSVGDLAFRKKSMEKMEEIRQKSSVIFISHNMYQVERICDRVIVLDKGRLVFYGETKEAIDHYYSIAIARGKKNDNRLIELGNSGDIKDLSLELVSLNGRVNPDFAFNEEISFKFSFYSEREYLEPILGISLRTSEGTLLGSVKNINVPESIDKISQGPNAFTIKLDKPNLLPGNYSISFKWKTNDNTSIVEATGLEFTVASDPELIGYDGNIYFSSVWSND